MARGWRWFDYGHEGKIEILNIIQMARGMRSQLGPRGALFQKIAWAAAERSFCDGLVSRLLQPTARDC